ncbi:MAG: hypothetical protein ACXVBE_07685, partial [Bdellovibrionota bacterium]
MDIQENLVSLNPAIAAAPLDERAKIFDMPAQPAPSLETRKAITGYTIAMLQTELASMGKEKYRAEQIFFWLYRRRVTSFADMTNLSKEVRAYLE